METQKLFNPQTDHNIFSTLLDKSDALIMIMDEEGKIIYFNQACQHVTGYSLEEVEHKHCWNIFLLPEDIETAKAGFKKILAGQSVPQQEVRWLAKNGTERLIVWSNTGIAHNNIIANIVAIGVDITDYKQEVVEQARLLAAERQQRQLADALRETGTALTATLDLDTLLDRLLDQVGHVVPYDAANIMLVEGDTIRVALTRGYNKFAPEVNESVTGLSFHINQANNLHRMVTTKQPAIISNTETDPDWINNKASKHLRSWAGAPIVAQDKVIAFFSLDKIEPGYYQPNHVALLSIFASQAGMALENVRLFDIEARRRREAETLYQITATLTSALELEEVLDNILVQLEKVVPYDSACILLLKKGVLQAVAGRGFADLQAIIGQEFSAEDLLFQETQQTRQPLYLVDAQADPRFNKWGDTDYVRGWLGVPLIVRQNVIGHLTLDSRQVGAYGQADTQLVKTLAGQAAIAIANAQLFKQTQTSLTQTEALYEATRSLIFLDNLPDLLQTIVDSVVKAIAANHVVLITLDLDQQKVIHFVSGGPGKNYAIRVSFNELWRGLTGWVIRELKPALSLKGAPDPREEPDVQKRRAETDAGSIIVVPLQYRDEKLGTLTAINQTNETDFTPQDVDLMMAIASQAAIAVKNAELFQEIKNAHQLSDSLREMGALLTETLNLSEVLERILDGLGNFVPFVSASVLLLDNNALHIKAARGIPENSLARNVGFSIAAGSITHNICNNKRAIIIPNVQDDPDWTIIEGDDYIKCWLGVPLIVHNITIGILTLDHNQPGFYTQNHITIATAFAQQAAIALENARLFEAANQRVTELEAVRQATLGLTSSLDFYAVLEAILDSTFTLIKNSQNAHIFLYQEKQLKFGASILADGTKNQLFAEPRKDGLTYTVAKKGELIAVTTMKNHPLFVNVPPHWQGAIVGLPLKIGSRVVGVMSISSQTPRNWTDAELHILQLLADQAAIAIENARLYEKIQQQAEDLKDNVAKRTFELQTLYELAQALGKVNQIEEVVQLVLRHLHQSIPHDVAASLLHTNSYSGIVIQSPHTVLPNAQTQLQNILFNTLGDALTEKTDNIETRPPQTNLDVTAPELPDNPIEHIKSTMAAPIVVGQKIIGAIVLANQENVPFSKERERLLHTIADQAAETIGRLQVLLAAEHQRLESLVAHMPNGVILLDTELRIVLCNQVAKDFIPLLTRATVGDKLAFLGNHSIQEILHSNSTESPTSVEIEGPSNRMFEIDISLVTVGPIAGSWTLVLREVTDERLIQRRIQQQERMAAVGQLAAGIAHDFNNILTSIIGFSELLLFEDTLSAPAKADVERITKQGHRAAHLVRQILDFSRQTIAEKRPLDVEPFLKETIKLLERTLPEDIHISLVANAGVYVITADLTQLQQALTNLAVNARDAMPTGGNLEFRLSKQMVQLGDPLPHPDITPGSWIVTTISDTGIGMSPEIQQLIFEPFFTTKEVGKGTGLGLAQVYGIVKQHEGHIGVNSQPDGGTTFRLYLPARSTTQSTSEQSSILAIPRGSGEIILLAEDDAPVLDIIKTMLRTLGYQVVTATNGLEALETFTRRKDEIALVLTDMTMPKMGGAQLAKALRAQHPTTKIIALTGYPLEKESKELLEQGIIDWLQKPLSLKVLAEAIHEALN